MKAIEHEDLIGVPFAIGGRDPSIGLDCVGLLLEVYRRAGIIMPSVPGGYGDTWGSDWEIIREMERLGWSRITGTVQALDAVLVPDRDSGLPTHVGVLLDESRVLHAHRSCGVVVTPLRALRVESIWRPSLVTVRLRKRLMGGDPEVRRVAWTPELSVRDLVPGDWDTDRCRVLVNGVPVSTVWLDTKVEPGSEVVVAIMPGDVGTIIISAIVGSVISLAVGTIINLILGPPKAVQERGDEASATYAWDGVQTNYGPGEVYPVVYGEHLVGGHVIQNFIRTNARGESELYTLLALSVGPIEGVGTSDGPFYSEDFDNLSGDDLPGGMYVNGNPVQSYQGVTMSFRKGRISQPPIEGFSDIVLAGGVQTSLEQGESFRYLTRSEIDAFEVNLLFSSGLYSQRKDGDIKVGWVAYAVEWRRRGAVSWDTDLATTVDQTSADSQRTLYVSDTSGFEEGDVVIIDVGGSKQEEHQVDSVTDGVSLKLKRDLEYEHTSAEAHRVVKCFMLTKRHMTEFTTTWRRDDLDRGMYEIRVTQGLGRHDTEGFQEGNLTSRSIFWNECNEVQYADLNYPMVALLGIKALATDQLSGGRPNFGATIRGRVVREWDGVSESEPAFDEHYSANPALVLLDILTHREYGLGSYFSDSHIDLATLRAWSEWCDELVPDGTGTETYVDADSDTGTNVLFVYNTDGIEPGDRIIIDYQGGSREDALVSSVTDGVSLTLAENLTYSHAGVDAHTVHRAHERCRFDGVFDTPGGGWDAVMQVCAVARAVPLTRGSRFGVKYEHEREAVQTFFVSNMKQGSFSHHVSGRASRANIIRVQYRNSEARYESDFEEYEHPSLQDSADTPRIREIQLRGVTRPAHALREAAFHAEVENRLRARVEFTVGVDAIACEPGDKVLISHDVPQWGFSGRCVAGGTTTAVAFDRDVSMLPSGTYEVTVRFSDGSIETKRMETVSGTHQAGTVLDLDIGESFAQSPEAGDLYSFGGVGVSTKPFTITRLVITPDFECQVEAVEYNENIFSMDDQEVDEPDYSALPNPDRIPDNVTGLGLAIEVQEQESGLSYFVRASWSWADPTLAPHPSRVWWRDPDGVWQDAGVTWSNSYRLPSAFMLNDLVEVSVTPESKKGDRKHPDSGTRASIAIRSIYPDDVTGFEIKDKGTSPFLWWDVYATWQPLDPDRNPRLSHYEIRKGANWTFGRTVAEVPFEANPATAMVHVELPVLEIESGYAAGVGERYFIRAVTHDGRQSLGVAQAKCIVPGFPLQPYRDNYACPDSVRPDSSSLPATVSDYSNQRSGNWAGSKTDLVVNSDGDLELDDGKRSGVYISTAIDRGSASGGWVGIICHVSSRDDRVLEDIQEQVDQMDGHDAYGDDLKPAVGYWVQYATSLDGMDWTPWVAYEKPVLVNTFRYLLARVIMRTTDPDYQPLLTQMAMMVEDY